MEFKIYEESRLKDLGELVEGVIKEWEIDPWYPTMEQLKEAYSREGFTPDTRHFLYDGDKLVAFLSSAMEDEVDGVQWGSIHMPFIRKGYEKAEEKLYEKAFGLLKSRGAKGVYAYSWPENGYIPELLEKWGFEKKDPFNKRAILSSSKFSDPAFEEPDYIKELNLKDDGDLSKFKEVYLKARTDVKAEDFDSTMKTFRERDLTISCILAKKGDEVLSYGLLYKDDLPERSYMSSIPIFNKEHGYVLKDIVDYLAYKAFKGGHKDIYHQLIDDDKEKMYNEMGIEFSANYRYELKFK
ncbi:MAG: hypothetical protein KGD64_03945 [Candidatus Heimdallarchaeota archaeon]|nr:hypothetical protein [Candidatus Heimdallarchaeota archaeon]